MTRSEARRLWDAVTKQGYAYSIAADVWAAKIAVDKKLGDFRIGSAVLYKSDPDIKVNQDRYIRIQNIVSI